jgi:cytochrome b6-f complex iron-sulfur subunit
MAINKKSKTKINRREFLGVTWVLSLIGLVGQAGAALYQFFKPRVEPGSFGGKVVAGRVGEFHPGSVNHIQKGRFYISYLEDGVMLALWHRCTHLGCTVPWREDEGRFHCPCHSSIFNTQGEVVSGPAPRPMDVFPITIEDDQIVVDTGKPTERQEYEPSQGMQI